MNSELKLFQLAHLCPPRSCTLQQLSYKHFHDITFRTWHLFCELYLDMRFMPFHHDSAPAECSRGWTRVKSAAVLSGIYCCRRTDIFLMLGCWDAFCQRVHFISTEAESLICWKSQITALCIHTWRLCMFSAYWIVTNTHIYGQSCTLWADTSI